MNRKLIFFILALIAVTFLVLIGFSLGERSLLGGLLSLLGSILTVGIGFMLKAKWRKEDESIQ